MQGVLDCRSGSPCRTSSLHPVHDQQTLETRAGATFAGEGCHADQEVTSSFPFLYLSLFQYPRRARHSLWNPPMINVWISGRSRIAFRPP